MSNWPLVSGAHALLTRRHALQLFLALPFAGLASRASAQDALGLEQDHPMRPVSERYQSLVSYRDTGTLETRYQWPGTPLVVEQHRFETAFRAPRSFFFRFDQDAASGGDAYVVWCDGGAFQSWWKATGVHTVHDNGQGAVAFYSGQSPTGDAVNLVAPHLFPEAMLYGPTWRLVDAEKGGRDDINGRSAWTVTASKRVTGVQTEENRPTKLWIDDASGLVVRVVVEAEAGSPEGLIDSREFWLAPEVDPELADAVFTFNPESKT